MLTKERAELRHDIDPTASLASIFARLDKHGGSLESHNGPGMREGMHSVTTSFGDSDQAAGYVGSLRADDVLSEEECEALMQALFGVDPSKN